MLGRLVDRVLRSQWIRLPSLQAKSPEWDRLFGSGNTSYAGIVVTDTNWMTFSAVFSAVNQISSDVAKVPLNLLKRLKGGGSEHYVDSRLYHLLKAEPNPEQSSMVFRQTLLAHALTCHGGYAEIERDMHGRPAALWTLTPDRVEPIRREQYDRATGRKTMGPLEYRIDGDDNQVLPARDVIHIHGLGYDGYSGYGVINKARQAIALALAMEKFGGQYFGKGTIFGGHLETEDDLDEDQKKSIRENIDAFRKAQDSAWRILVTGAGHKFHQFSSKPNESQMDESRTAQVLEVARFFRMPPVKLGVNTPGTVSYASVEMANIDYYTGCLLDWYTLTEQEFNRKLIAAPERRQQYIKHNVNAFMRGDTAARSAYYSAMLDRGVFNADDVLELEDLNPQAGGIGKMYLVQGAQVPKDQLSAVIDAKIKKDSTPPPAPVAPAADQGDEDDVREALTSVTEAMAALGEQLAAMATQQRNLEAQSADLAAMQATVAERDAALAATTATTEQRTTERDAAIARAEALALTAATATTDRETHEAAAAQARQDAAAAVQRADAAIAAQQDAEASAAAATEMVTLLTADRNSMFTDLEATRARVADIEAQLTAAHATAAADATDRAAALATAAESLASAQAARDQAQQHLAGERASRIERMTATIAAHRGLIADVLGRMTRRLAQQARSKQATPEKLRRWLAGVVSVETPLCQEALLPAMRVRLAAKGSTEDPVRVTSALVAEHLATFEALMRDVLDAPAEDFHADLERVLVRWETERAGLVADALLEEEIRHVRAL